MFGRFFTPLCFLSVLIAWPLPSRGDAPVGYYNAAENQQGTALRQVLHGLVDQHAALTYLATREALKLTDESPANTAQVLLIYSQRSEDKTNFVTNGGNATQWNREHLWPNSLGIDDVEPAYSDLFNLRPADVEVNSRRGNLIFDEYSAAEAPILTDPEAPLCTRDSNSWEVPAAEKGDIARSMFYMDIRYEGDVAGEPDLILTDNLAEISNIGTKFGRLTTLLLWHLSDPVSAAERLRNDVVHAQQGNRNPFVDRPEFVALLYGNPLEINLQLTPTQVRLSWWSTLATPTESLNLQSWQGVPGIPQVEGNQKVLWRPRSAASHFFRLSYQVPNVP
jgi:endonuclease I